MWKLKADDRLDHWKRFRQQIGAMPIDQALTACVDFWQKAPFTPFYLDHNNTTEWPDPWQLVYENWYCDLAKALGILYTVSLLDRADMADAELVLAEDGSNLVLVAKEKYILNWNRDSIVNNKPKVKIIRKLKQHQIK